MIDNIARYRTFLTVAESASVSEAAKKLYVSQPAVSADIAALEDELKVRLFFRGNRGVTATPEGRVLYEYVKKAFAFLETGEDKLREITGLRSGALRIGASDMTLRFYLLDYIEAFRRRYPDVHLNVTNAPTPKTLEALRGGSIDFAVISEPLPADTEDLTLLPVREIRDVFIASPRFAIAKEKKVTKARLSQEPIIMLERRTSTRRYVSDFLGDDFPPPAIELATSDLLLAFALRGLGVSSIVYDFAAEAIKNRSVSEIGLCEPLPPRRFFVAYLRKMPLSVASRAMLALLSENTKNAIQNTTVSEE